jgi:hypothetical protein
VALNSARPAAFVFLDTAVAGAAPFRRKETGHPATASVGIKRLLTLTVMVFISALHPALGARF